MAFLRMISNATAYAHQGIQRGFQRLESAAEKVADPRTELDLSTVVEIKRAEQEITVNAAVMSVADHVMGELIDIVA